MKAFEVTFIIRMRLLSILSQAKAADGGMDKLDAMFKAYEQLKFPEEESKRIIFTELQEGDQKVTKVQLHMICPSCDGPYMVEESAISFRCGVCNYATAENPEPDFGKKVITLEDAQASWLYKELKAWMPNAMLRDREWLQLVMAKLEAPVNSGKKKGKR